MGGCQSLERTVQCKFIADNAGILLIRQNDHLKKVYESLKTAQKNDLAKCGKAFTEEVLPTVPPIFHEWFMSNFPEPTAWFKARTNYGRTAAVMSMVGFVLGLVTMSHFLSTTR